MVTLSGVMETDMEEGVEDEEEREEGEDELAEDNISGDSLKEDDIAEDDIDSVYSNKVEGEDTSYKIISTNVCVSDAEEKIEQGGENAEDVGEVTEHEDNIEQNDTYLAYKKEGVGDIIVVHKVWKYQFEVKL